MFNNLFALKNSSSQEVTQNRIILGNNSSYMQNPMIADDNIFSSYINIQDDTSDSFRRSTNDNLPVQSGDNQHVVNSLVDKDGKIGATAQGEDKGDCWLLSAINSLNATPKGREILSNMIEVKDGQTILHFGANGAKTDITVTDEEVARARENESSHYSSGDDDMIAIEIGVEKYLASVNYNNNTPSYVEDKQEGSNQSSIDSGNFEKAIYILAGKAGTVFKTNSIIKDGKTLKNVNGIEEAIKLYTNSNSNGQIMNASIGKGDSATLTDLNSNSEFKIEDGHQYSVKSISGDKVTIVNPWDSEKEFTISLDDFKGTFTQIEYADLNNDSDNRNYNK